MIPKKSEKAKVKTKNLLQPGILVCLSEKKGNSGLRLLFGFDL